MLIIGPLGLRVIYQDTWTRRVILNEKVGDEWLPLLEVEASKDDCGAIAGLFFCEALAMTLHEGGSPLVDHPDLPEDILQEG